MAAPPISASVYWNDSPSAAPAALSTRVATAMISGPMPSPGSTHTLWAAARTVSPRSCALHGLTALVAGASPGQRAGDARAAIAAMPVCCGLCKRLQQRPTELKGAEEQVGGQWA